MSVGQNQGSKLGCELSHDVNNSHPYQNCISGSPRSVSSDSTVLAMPMQLTPRDSSTKVSKRRQLNDKLKKLFSENKNRPLKELTLQFLAKERDLQRQNITVDKVFAILWQRKFCTKSDKLVHRSQVFNHYETHCRTAGVPLVTKIHFGMLIKTTFPNVGYRRLEKKDYYDGLSLVDRLQEATAIPSMPDMRDFAILWIKSSCQKSSSSIARDTVFSHYAGRCVTKKISPLSKTAFSMLIHSSFPFTRTQTRLRRGKDSNHYPYLSLVDDIQEVTDTSAGSSVADVCRETDCSGRSQLPAENTVFPSTEIPTNRTSRQQQVIPNLNAQIPHGSISSCAAATSQQFTNISMSLPLTEPSFRSMAPVQTPDPNPIPQSVGKIRPLLIDDPLFRQKDIANNLNVASSTVCPTQGLEGEQNFTRFNNPNWLESELFDADLSDSYQNRNSDGIQPANPASAEQTPRAISPLSPTGSNSSCESYFTAQVTNPASTTAELAKVHKLVATLRSQTTGLLENLESHDISNNHIKKVLKSHLILMEKLDPKRNSAEVSPWGYEGS